jgi:hypothetical protein
MTMLFAAAALASACALLTAGEIASVQGERPARVRRSKRQPEAVQCRFALPTATKFVDVEVTRGPRVAQLAERLRLAALVEGEESGEFEAPAVESVQGLGDEAWWAEGVRQGALYVRRGATLLRIAVGGDEDKAAKMTKLRLLVGKALGRLRE